MATSTSTRYPLRQPPRQSVCLIDQRWEPVRFVHYSMLAEQASFHCVRTFARCRVLRHPRGLGKLEFEGIRRWLANERLAVVTYKQTLCCTLEAHWPWLSETIRPRSKLRQLLAGD